MLTDPKAWNRSPLPHCLILCLALVAAAGPAFADAVVRTQAMSASTVAEIFVEDERVRVELEIGVSQEPGELPRAVAGLEGSGRSLIDAAAWRILQLILVCFVLLLLYRAASIRIRRPRNG